MTPVKTEMLRLYKNYEDVIEYFNYEFPKVFAVNPLSIQSVITDSEDMITDSGNMNTDNGDMITDKVVIFSLLNNFKILVA